MISSLTAENLACVRGDKSLFEGLSFRVRAGQALAVEGANGAGKTSLLRVLAGLLAPVAGRVLVRTGTSDSDDVPGAIALNVTFALSAGTEKGMLAPFGAPAELPASA